MRERSERAVDQAARGVSKAVGVISGAMAKVSQMISLALNNPAVDAYCLAGCPYGLSKAGLERWLDQWFQSGVFTTRKRWTRIRPWMYRLAVKLRRRRKRCRHY